jgi:hypothetical protein
MEMPTHHVSGLDQLSLDTFSSQLGFMVAVSQQR